MEGGRRKEGRETALPLLGHVWQHAACCALPLQSPLASIGSRQAPNTFRPCGNFMAVGQFAAEGWEY